MKETDRLKTLKAQNIGAEEYDFLTKPGLMGRIEGELNKKIVGEYKARLTVLLVALGGSLTVNASPTSKNLMVNDESGAGKDHVTNNVLKLLPGEMVVKRKKITPEVFTYWKNAEVEPEWTWDGKVFYCEDISNKILNCDTFKVMASSDGENQSTVVVKQTAKEITTKGKPVMIITIASANPGAELLRRFPIVNLNITREQTRKILERQAKFAVTGTVPEYDFNIKKALYQLKRVRVKVLFAEKLQKHLSAEHHIMRTNFPRLLDLIKFSASIHQYQREETKDQYILANKQDYAIARDVFLSTTKNEFSVPLTKKEQEILKILLDNKDLWLSASELELRTTMTYKTIRGYLDRLTEYGLLEHDKVEREESSRPVMVWRHKGVSNINLPMWDEMNRKIPNGNNSKITPNTPKAPKGGVINKPIGVIGAIGVNFVSNESSNNNEEPLNVREESIVLSDGDRILSPREIEELYKEGSE